MELTLVFIACLFTILCTIQNTNVQRSLEKLGKQQTQFFLLQVGEVIEEAVKSNIQLVGVRLLEGSIYLSAGDKNSLEALLAKGITLRTIQLTLHDVSAGTVVLSLSGVPHQLSDKDLTHVLSQFGPVIGEKLLFLIYKVSFFISLTCFTDRM